MVSKRIELVDEEQFILLPTPKPEPIVISDSFSLTQEYIRLYTDVVAFTGYHVIPNPTRTVNVSIYAWDGTVTKEIQSGGATQTCYAVGVDRRGGFYVSTGTNPNNVTRFNSAGVVDTSWGIGGSLAVSWRDFYIDADDNVYAEGTDANVSKRDKYGNLIWSTGSGDSYSRCIDVSANYVYRGYYNSSGGRIISRYFRSNGVFDQTLFGYFSSSYSCEWMYMDERKDRAYLLLKRSTGSIGRFYIGRLSDEYLITYIDLGSSAISDAFYFEGYFYLSLNTTGVTIQGFTGSVFKIKVDDDVITIVAAYDAPNNRSSYGICLDQHRRIWVEQYEFLTVLDTDLNLLFFADDVGGSFGYGRGLGCIPNTREFDIGFLPYL
jgi:hypothetical protein